MFIDNQVPRDIRDIKAQMAELIARELDGVVSRASIREGHGLSLEEALAQAKASLESCASS